MCSSSLVASLTLAPAVLVIGSRFGLLEPKRKTAKRGWRRIGTAIVRWPGPILIATLALAFVGLAALSGYKVSYDVSRYMPASAPSNVGYAAAERHFSKARLNPELLMIETDHDLRNPTDMILLERVAKAVFHTDGIAQVQSITRPLGTPLDHTSIPFQISAQSAAQINNLPFQQDRAADLLKQVGDINKSIDILRQQYALQQQSSDITHEQSRGVPADRRRGSGPARQDRQLRRLLPAAAQLLLLGATLFRHPDLLRHCGPSSTRSTASTR